MYFLEEEAKMTQLEKVVEYQNYLKGFFKQVIEEVETILPQHMQEISSNSLNPALEKLSITVNDECMSVRVSFSKIVKSCVHVNRIEIISEHDRPISVPIHYSIEVPIKNL